MCIKKDDLDFKSFISLNFLYTLSRFRRKLKGVMLPAGTVLCVLKFSVFFSMTVNKVQGIEELNYKSCS